MGDLITFNMPRLKFDGVKMIIFAIGYQSHLPV